MRRAVSSARGALLPAALALAASGACSSHSPIVREVPLVRDVLPDPPFPEGWRAIDLTLPLDAAAPRASHPRQFPFERIELPPDAPGGARSGAFTAMEHMGTHLAAPRTRFDGGATVDTFGGTDLLLPVVVLDLPPNLAPDAPLPVEEIAADERDRGLFPRGAAILLRTRRPAAPHSGFSVAGARLLGERRARIVGTDAPAIDASASKDGPAQQAAADAGVFLLANLRNLDELPPRGAWLVVGVLPVVGASGAPARVVALVPTDPGGRPR
jgi:kynurenine formamidase